MRCECNAIDLITYLSDLHIYIFFFNLCRGILDTAATTGLLYQPRMIGEGDCGEIGRIKIGREKTYPIATLSTTNPT
jgi:hypothetical protein